MVLTTKQSGASINNVDKEGFMKIHNGKGDGIGLPKSVMITRILRKYFRYNNASMNYLTLIFLSGFMVYGCPHASSLKSRSSTVFVVFIESFAGGHHSTNSRSKRTDKQTNGEADTTLIVL